MNRVEKYFAKSFKQLKETCKDDPELLIERTLQLTKQSEGFVRSYIIKESHDYAIKKGVFGMELR